MNKADIRLLVSNERLTKQASETALKTATEAEARQHETRAILERALAAHNEARKALDKALSDDEPSDDEELAPGLMPHA